MHRHSNTSRTPNATPKKLPSHRIDLEYHTGAIAWIAALREPGSAAIVEIVAKGRHDEALIVADQALDEARARGIPLVVPAHLRDSLTAQWWQAGREIYKEGLPLDLCSNKWERAGWIDSARDDGRPYPADLFGWAASVNWDSAPAAAA